MPRRRRGRNSKSEDIVELDDLPKVTLLGEKSVDEDNVFKTQHEEASIIICPPQSTSRAEFQETVDGIEASSTKEKTPQWDVSSESEKTDQSLNDWNPNEIIDVPKQEADFQERDQSLSDLKPNEITDVPKQDADFQAPGSMETELVAKSLTRSDSLETFTGGDDSPRNNPFKFFKNMDSGSSSLYQRQFTKNGHIPVNDWVCIVTEKHPETSKPIHHGKIRSFRNLFENSFDMNCLFDPNARDNFQNLRPIKFNGYNVEMYREFEQSVLIRIINNNNLDFDEKFLFLLDTLSGSPLAVVQAFSDELDAPNFVRAIEALYYAYGEPTKFRNALVRQLINEEPIDIRNPESFLKINCLITRIFRAFGNDASNEILSLSFILESIQMTSETGLAFETWLCTTMKEKNLKVLQQWLEWMYRHCVSMNFSQKTPQGFKNFKSQPVLTNMIHPNYEELLKARCKLCFCKIHVFESCFVYMSMSPNQRKIALILYGGCFLCTKIVHTVHVGSNCNLCDRRNCGRPCQICGSQEHHFTICEASDEPFKAVLKH